MIYQVATQIELGNLTGEVLQVDVEEGVYTGDISWIFSTIVAHSCLGPTLASALHNVSSTSYFVACTLNATTTTPYLSMQDERATLTTSLPSDNDLVSWSIWSLSSDPTNLTTGASILFTASFIGLIYDLVEYGPICISRN